MSSPAEGLEPPPPPSWVRAGERPINNVTNDWPIAAGHHPEQSNLTSIASSRRSSLPHCSRRSAVDLSNTTTYSIGDANGA